MLGKLREKFKQKLCYNVKKSSLFGCNASAQFLDLLQFVQVFARNHENQVFIEIEMLAQIG